MESHCLHIIDTKLNSFSKKDSFQSLVKMMQVCLVSCLWMYVSWEMLASSGPFPSHHLVTWRCWLSARITVTSGFTHLQLSGARPLPTDFTHVFLELLLSPTSTIWFLVSENQPPGSKPQDGLLVQGLYLSPSIALKLQGLEFTVFISFYCLENHLELNPSQRHTSASLQLPWLRSLRTAELVFLLVYPRLWVIIRRAPIQLLTESRPLELRAKVLAPYQEHFSISRDPCVLWTQPQVHSPHHLLLDPPRTSHCNPLG